MKSNQPGFFSGFARHLQRTEILIIGVLLEKGAATRRTVLREAKLVTMTGIPAQTLDKTLRRLALMTLITREQNGRNFEYRVLLENLRTLKQPTFPDRTSLSAQLSFEGFGRLPAQTRLPGQPKAIILETATLDTLLKVRDLYTARAKSQKPRNARLEQIDKLIALMETFDAKRTGLTVREVLALQGQSLAHAAKA